jgi:prephenate dehydratase
MYESRAKDAVAELEAIAEEGWVRVLGSYDTEHAL